MCSDIVVYEENSGNMQTALPVQALVVHGPLHLQGRLAFPGVQDDL